MVNFKRVGQLMRLMDLDEALDRLRPETFNTDKGSQFTSREYTGRLEAARIALIREGRGRALDNVFVERLWRSVKYEDVDIKDYEQVPDLKAGLAAYFRVYDEERPHQSLGYGTPRAGSTVAASAPRIPGRDHDKSRPPGCSVSGVHLIDR